MADTNTGNKIAKNDFIEIDFTGKVLGTNEIFDTTVLDVAKEAKFNLENLKPTILSVGKQMILPGLDKDLEGKEIGKSYTINIKPEQAFGKRNSQMVRMIPLKHFIEQEIYPQKGMQLSLDNQVVKVLSNSGGRVLVDFNNPLAGKPVTYEYKILRRVPDEKEQINAVQDFLFRKQFDFSIEDPKDNEKDKKKSVKFKIPKSQEPLKKFLEMFAKPFEDILGMSVSTEVFEDLSQGKGELQENRGLPKEEKKEDSKTP